jgi:hypothetical protein
MKFTMTVTLTKRWMAGFLKGCLVGFVTYCALEWKWKGLGVAFENHDVASIERLLIAAIITAIGVSIGIRWPVKMSFHRSQDDIAAEDTGTQDESPEHQSGRGYEMGLALAAKIKGAEQGSLT